MKSFFVSFVCFVVKSLRHPILSILSIHVKLLRFLCSIRIHRRQKMPLRDWEIAKGYTARRRCRTCGEEQVLIPGLQVFMLLALMLCMGSGCMACKKAYVYAWDTLYPPPSVTTTNGVNQ